MANPGIQRNRYLGRYLGDGKSWNRYLGRYPGDGKSWITKAILYRISKNPICKQSLGNNPKP